FATYLRPPANLRRATWRAFFGCRAKSRAGPGHAPGRQPARMFQASWIRRLILLGSGVIFRAPSVARAPRLTGRRVETILWCGSQAVRQWFAKPSYVGSNPIRTSRHSE